MADGTARDLTGLLESIGGRDGRLVHLQRTPARPGRHADWPDWADPDLVAAYRRLGVERPWTHQVAAAHSAHAGRHTVLATGTGSGKSLAAWLPALSDVLTAQSPGADSRISAHTRRPTTLYLSPTKALAADQAAALARLVGELEAVQREAGTPAGSLRTVRAGTCDGDTPLPERDWVRAHADVVLTNPDFLHFSLLPGHERWTRLLRGLRYIVIDECHAYRGILGAHVALVLRRLLRLVARLRPHDPQPVVLCASATAAEPALTAARLIGVEPDDVVAVTEDGAPAGERTLALWQPALRDPWVLSVPSNGGPAPVGSPSPAALNGTSSSASSPSPDAPRPTSADDDSLPAPSITTPPQHVSGTEATPKASPAAIASTAHGRPPVTSGATPPGSVEPDSGDLGEDPSARRSAVVEAAELLVDLLSVGARALVFVRSRRSAEVVAERARHTLGLSLPELVGTVSAYRGGYLPEERRALEADLRSGRLRALATTNALELGIDVTGLDAVLIAGWPGTRVSLGQQAGRAGRAGTRGLAVLIASDNPLDAYLVHHPEAVFAAPEATVFDPANPYVLAPHLCAAASEAPLRAPDLALFGLPDDALLRELEGRGALRRRPTGWFWNVNLPGRPQDLTSLRGDGPPQVPVVEADTGVVIGTVDGAAADSTVHEGAVYVHQGRVYVVEELADDVALVRRKAAVGYRTRARSRSSVRIIAEREQQVWGQPGPTTPGGCREPSAHKLEEPAGSGGGSSAGPDPASDGPGPAGSGQAGSASGDAPEPPSTTAITWSFGSVEVTSQVTGYQRMALPGGEVVSQHALEMDEHVLPTAAVWWTIPQEVCEAAGLEPTDLPGALHAAEHASIGMLPLLATCDRWDIGGLSTALHPQTGAPTVFVHDGHAGGAGFAERGYRAGRDWLEATLAVIEGCGCASGCPSCVQSPKCGNNNEPLDKAGAAVLLRLLLEAAPQHPSTADPAHRELSRTDDFDAPSSPVTRSN
ncbi:DEAD/DEAH box helicase [Actinomyces sp. HMSC075C01]|uniref:DEAD/DEAH box helicase n=1 Tax=Actinomyces oris TaxID=544580 RepID=A0A1Q8VSD7_9ACTO|nr:MULTISPECIES: DEAD/DEAH box helicase [Actinomyces]OFR54620.1 DEAD/DEAH box helicase [Actinomyces sp. HMSC075C01]OLO50985.1 DEAD/DEAH box helicase [Actinomyces oris]